MNKKLVLLFLALSFAGNSYFPLFGRGKVGKVEKIVRQVQAQSLDGMGVNQNFVEDPTAMVQVEQKVEYPSPVKVVAGVVVNAIGREIDKVQDHVMNHSADGTRITEMRFQDGSYVYVRADHNGQPIDSSGNSTREESQYVSKDRAGNILKPRGGLGSVVGKVVFNPFTAAFTLTITVAGLVIAAIPVAPFFAIRYAFRKLEEDWKKPGFISETDYRPLLLKLFKRAPQVGDMTDFVAPKEFKAKLENYVDELKTLVQSKSEAGTMALFYGSYGVGKTFVAKKVARAAGLGYAVVRCSSIAQNKDFAKMLTDKLTWARKKGVLLILDEAEELLGAEQDNTKDRMVVNELISQMGTPEKRPHMIILTNHPSRLNQAFIGKGGRINRMFEFPAPDIAAVQDMLSKMIAKQVVALKVAVDSTFDLTKAAKVVGVRAGREVFDIVVEACLQAKVSGKPLNIENLKYAVTVRDNDRDALDKFKLPVRKNGAIAVPKAPAEIVAAINSAAAA